jgi:hypothetical protein
LGDRIVENAWGRCIHKISLACGGGSSSLRKLFVTVRI